MRRLIFSFFLILFFIVIPAGLAVWLGGIGLPAGVSFHERDFSDLEGWQKAGHKRAFSAFLKSCESLEKRGLPAARKDFQAVCRHGQDNKDSIFSSPNAARTFFEEHFTPLQIKIGWEDEGLLTGYYEPLIEANPVREDGFTVPLYRKPADQVYIDLGQFREDLAGSRLVGRVQGLKVLPYYSRSEINAGALEDRGLELLWANDPVDVFFLQVQGSGRARLPDGEEVRIGYAGGNGHPYTSIGRVLIKMDALERENVSLQTIRTWLAENPVYLDQVLNRNASYVFFRLLNEEGPIGSAGSVLTPEHSLAVDTRHIPLGLPVWIEGEKPALDTPLRKTEPFHRLMVAQDTGGAINGALRGDVFWGHGQKAEILAGHMKHQGKFFILVPRLPEK